MRAIACVDADWGIGKDGGLLFKRFTPDMQTFKAFTTLYDKRVVMGRRTYESLPGRKPLPDRENIILTKSGITPDGFEVVSSIDELIDRFGYDMWVIGGESIYRQLLPYTMEIILTRVLSGGHGADTFFPNVLEGGKFLKVSEASSMTWKDLEYTYEYYQRSDVHDTLHGRDHECITGGERKEESAYNGRLLSGETFTRYF